MGGVRMRGFSGDFLSGVDNKGMYCSFKDEYRVG